MLKISFIGDISFNNEYNNMYQSGAQPFEDIEPVLSDSDIVVGNLEYLAKGDDGENTLKNPRLQTKNNKSFMLQTIRKKIPQLKMFQKISD